MNCTLRVAVHLAALKEAANIMLACITKATFEEQVPSDSSCLFFSEVGGNQDGLLMGGGFLLFVLTGRLIFLITPDHHRGGSSFFLFPLLRQREMNEGEGREVVARVGTGGSVD